MFPAPQISRARSSRSAQGVMVKSTEIIVGKYFRRCSMVLGAQRTHDSGRVVRKLFETPTRQAIISSGDKSRLRSPLGSERNESVMIWGRGVHAKRHESGMGAVLLLWRADREHKHRSLSLDHRNG